MSLARLALRLLTVAALTGRTDAGGKVCDSEIVPIDERADEVRLPYIAVYVDDAEAKGSKLDMFPAEGSVTLILEIGVTARVMSQVDDDGEAVLGWGIPPTDAGLEMMIDIIERQARVAIGDPTDPWSVLWRRVVTNVRAIKVVRGASDRNGVRFAGRQLALVCDIIADPQPGQPLAAVWADVAAALKADTNLQAAGEAFETLSLGDRPAWLAAQVGQGLTPNGVRALGIAPVFQTMAEPPPTAVSAGVIDDLGVEMIEGE